MSQNEVKPFWPKSILLGLFDSIRNNIRDTNWAQWRLPHDFVLLWPYICTPVSLACETNPEAQYDHCDCTIAAIELMVAFTTAFATTGTSLATLWMGGILGPSKVSRIPANRKTQQWQNGNVRPVKTETLTNQANVKELALIVLSPHVGWAKNTCEQATKHVRSVL